MKKAFTLIELMIVIAIIAIIAAIAIPNLLEARRQANETNAVAALKSYATAQSQFMRAGYLAVGRSKYYAPVFGLLYQTVDTAPADAAAVVTLATAKTKGDGEIITLINDTFANADEPALPYQGYYFGEPAGNNSRSSTAETGVVVPINWAAGFELFAFPAAPGSSGNNCFFINSQGTVKMKRFSGAATTADTETAANAEFPFGQHATTWFDA